MLGDQALISIQGMSTQPVAVVALLILAGIGWFVVTARDARRFVARRDRCDHRGVHRVLSEHRGAADAVDDLQRVPGLPAHVPLPVPVPGQHGPGPGQMPSIFSADPNLFNLPPVLVLGGVLAIACLVVGVQRVVVAGRPGRPR